VIVFQIDLYGIALGPTERDPPVSAGVDRKPALAVSPRVVRRRTAVVENWQIPPVRAQPQLLRQADDIAAAALHLVSDESAFVTGIELLVDRGYAQV
jgi:NAD(P)-dependent dehydrogenase (short-subunit alcohol dehydrogenase family)